MYLPEHHYLLPQDCVHLSGVNDIYTLYALKNPKVFVSPTKGSYSSFIVLALTYECHYITYENMTLLFPKIFTRNRFMSFCTHLSQRGLLKSERFVSHDNASYAAYCLTQKGMDYIQTILCDFKEHNVKVRRTGGKVSMHDYCTGVNMMHFLLSPFRYEWIKETVVTGATLKTKGSLCPDITIQINSVLLDTNSNPIENKQLSEFLSGDSREALPEGFSFQSYKKRLCIEEDLGTEPTGTLLHKLSLYDDHGLFNPDTLLIFSIRKSGIAYDGDGYSHRRVSSLISHMEEAGADSLYDYYMSCPSDDKGVARQILMTVGVIKPDTSEYNKDIRLGKNKKRDFTLEELKRYHTELSEYRNLYRIRDFHAEQVRFTRSRKESVSAVLERYMSDSARIGRRELLLLLSGKRAYFLPTNILANYYPILFPDLYKMHEKMQQSLKCYGYVYDTNAKVLSIKDDDLPLDLPTVLIRNLYKRDDDLPGRLIVEDIGHDLSAHTRVLYLRKYYKTDTPFTVICIVDSVEDAVSFASRLNYYHVTESLSKNRNGYYYILTHDIGRENKIFSIGDLEGVREFYLKPDDDKGQQSIADFLF